MLGPEELHDSLFELSTMLLGEETLASLLQRIVDMTCAAVSGSTHVGMSLLNSESVTTAAATNGTTLQLDGAQYSNGEGPCLHAARTGRVVRVDDMATDSRFAAFASEALRLGIHSSLSMPLTVRGSSIGALNLYGSDTRAFSEASEHLAERFARQASATLANAEIHSRTVALVTQLNEALVSRSIIDQARGVLIARTGCSAEEAITTLKQRSQHENRKLRLIAEEMVHEAMTQPDQMR
jgi:GAF domain-containing protein